MLRQLEKLLAQFALAPAKPPVTFKPPIGVIVSMVTIPALIDNILIVTLGIIISSKANVLSTIQTKD